MARPKSRHSRSYKSQKRDDRSQASTETHGAPRARRSWIVGGLAALLVAGCGLLIWQLGFGPSSIREQRATTPEAQFVGSETCAGCHKPEAGLWQTSQHKHAMDHATEKSVLGDFNDTVFETFGQRSRFFRRDGKFYVETDGPDGKPTEYEIKYTFGLDPLQQYLIEFPDGRLQALSIAWDSRPKDKGGQRWFHLYPDEKIDHKDILHWTKLSQNWNFMCAECHSTGVRKNYDAANDRFKTTFAEINVGCETCHGQGSNHVAWAKAKQSWWPHGKADDDTLGLLVRFTDRLNATWSLEKNAATATRNLPPPVLRKEVETCGLCHARRGQISEDWKPGRWLSETHNVSPLSRGLYHPDGQMLDEVYNYGSFKQSKMFAAGVTCGDCHDPHSGKTRLAGDNLCLQCHAADKFATPTHNRHADVTPALTCAACHMPTRTYMVVDPRHDHSFRVPRPDLSTKLGTPNACNDCHKDKSSEWAAAAIAQWHGPERKGFQNYGPAFHAAWSNQPGAGRALSAIAGDTRNPAFARAGALTDLNAYLSPETAKVAQASLRDQDPLVRIGALDALDGIPVQQLWPVVASALTDPVRGVRMRAAALLAAMPASQQPPQDRASFEKATQEFISAQRLNADRPEARTTLGNFLARQGRVAEAEQEYQAALRLNEQFVPAAVNLAGLYSQQRQESKAEAILRKAIEVNPRDASLHHALGLGLTRDKRPAEALEEFKIAADLQPESARYNYVYGVALHAAGRSADAIQQLEKTIERQPGDRDTLVALVSYYRAQGDTAGALKYAELLTKAFPQDNAAAQLLRELRGNSGR